MARSGVGIDDSRGRPYVAWMSVDRRPGEQAGAQAEAAAAAYEAAFAPRVRHQERF